MMHKMGTSKMGTGKKSRMMHKMGTSKMGTGKKSGQEQYGHEQHGKEDGPIKSHGRTMLR